MESLLRRGLPGLALALALAASGRAAAQYYAPIPPPRYERGPGRPPGPNYVWRPGHWDWRGRGYVWVPGAWVRRPRRGAWRAGRWAYRSGRQVWVPGGWY
jgi:hypothetical protein